MTQKTASKFTPGPWIVVSGLPTLINSGGMRAVGEPYRSIASTHVYKGDTTLVDEANARLIAKAPEMYELLEAAISICDFMDAGVLVRSTKNDDDPQWAVKQIPLVKALKSISEARRIKAEIDGEG